ncbi:MAG: hypothetical protein JWN66_2189 [Sphingomonas bacterium]|uniref:hypothetical protein n=1 Tax=Sphingomonas bacterium TaxID=1895847 RepID=UPI00260BA3B6|nr:hypothetical protein [Sphingomonas bacterium]MDB5705073.1 hypothetical protein [Sphingomonas bacterium]
MIRWPRRRAGRILLVVGVIALIGIVFLGIRVWQVRTTTAIAHIGSLAVEHHLMPDDLAALAPVQADFGVAGGGDMFLQTGKGLVEVAPGGSMSIVHGPGAPALTSLAIGGDDAMLTVAADYLGALNTQGVPVLGRPLPYPGARVAPSVRPGEVYLFSRVPGGYRAYRFRESGTFQKLFQFDAAIVSIADTKDALYVATGTMVVRMARTGGDLVFRVPEDDRSTISSIAVSADGILFVATEDSIYAVIGKGALTIVNDSGGEIRWRNDALHVLDRRRSLFYSVRPATLAMFDRKAA